MPECQIRAVKSDLKILMQKLRQETPGVREIEEGWMVGFGGGVGDLNHFLCHEALITFETQHGATKYHIFFLGVKGFIVT